MPAKASPHRFTFFRAGGVDQVALTSAADLANLAELDPKLWVAVSMPTRGVDLDPRMLDLIDTDKDGRIRLPEVLAAVKWAVDTYKDVDRLFEAGDEVPLDALRDGPVLTAARWVLASLGKKGAGSVTLADAGDTAKVLGANRFNGDGVIDAAAAEDDATRKVIEEIAATVGTVPDRSGKPGLDKAKVDAFFAEVKALLEWHGKGEPVAAQAKAAAAVRAVKAKVDDFFTRVRLAGFDPRAGAALTGAEADFTALGRAELAPGNAEVARLPIARIEPGRALPLVEGVNPAWAAPLATLAADAVGAGRTSLSEADWRALVDKVAPFEAWSAARPAGAAEKLGLPRLREIAEGGFQDGIGKLMEQDLAAKPEADRVVEVDKLCRFQRDLIELLRNFVNFSAFYRREGAVFQAGTLYLDGRSCDLVVEVIDAAKHGTLAGMSGACLIYCDITRGAEKKAIAAALTAGDADNLVAGRNGVFYDRLGRDWDATITKIIANPISVREAFWAPYKKFARLIEEQVAKRASAADAASQSKLDAAALAAANVDKTKPPAPTEPKKIDVGTVAAIGVAIGGIGAMVAGILAAFLGLGAWMPIGVVALLLMFSGPSMLLAWLKLRQRNLGPLLDANGWAINTRARINVPFGAALTALAALPAGARRLMQDPYAEKRSPWRLYITVAAVIALGASWYLGKLDKYLPGAAKSTSVLGKYAPAAPPAPPSAPSPLKSEGGQ